MLRPKLRRYRPRHHPITPLTPHLQNLLDKQKLEQRIQTIRCQCFRGKAWIEAEIAKARKEYHEKKEDTRFKAIRGEIS